MSFIADNTPLSHGKGRTGNVDRVADAAAADGAAAVGAAAGDAALAGDTTSVDAAAPAADAAAAAGEGTAEAAGAAQADRSGEPGKMTLSAPDYSQVSLDPTCRLSPYASIVGAVTVGPEASVFAGAHIRGDADSVSIGARTNIQENCSLHTSGGAPLTIGDDVTVGHGAIVHGCTIDDNVLIGMGSIVMDHSHIGEYSLVGAGALVTEHKEFPPRSLILGSPARAVRTLSDEEIDELIVEATAAYVDISGEMVREGVMVHPDADERIWSTPAFGRDAAAKLAEKLGLDRKTARALVRQLIEPSDSAADA